MQHRPRQKTLTRMRRALGADHPQTLAMADSPAALREQSGPEQIPPGSDTDKRPVGAAGKRASLDSLTPARDLAVNNYAGTATGVRIQAVGERSRAESQFHRAGGHPGSGPGGAAYRRKCRRAGAAWHGRDRKTQLAIE